jgi:glycine/D-amino acid oxidase-like deaminating enzyme
MKMQEAEVIVAGAGAIGLCTALQLRLAGREVLLVDRDEPGAGASRGNAGVLATYECVPLGTPGVLRSLPRLLFDVDSPLSISLSALPKLSPWLLRFARASLADRTRQGAAALAALLKNSLDAYLPLLDQAGAQHLLRRDGALHLFRSERDVRAARWERELRSTLGIPQVILDRRQLESLEPALPRDYAHGILFPDAAHVIDPFELMRHLARAFVESGGVIARAEISQLHATDDKVTLSAPEMKLRASTLVLAMGAWSTRLTRQLGDRIPLETERGYHVEFPMKSPLLTRPICPLDLGFYFTPMQGRLRAAGTVELSSIERPANPRRLQLIERSARLLFPTLGPAQATWLGFRPSLPDSLPVIGRSPRARNVVYAFGHGHLGVTLAAETGRLVTQLIASGHDAPDLRALSPTRFG